MGREFEIKLRVPSEETLRRILQDPSVRALAMGEDRQIRMESTYFDTADRLLARRRWTLRRRRENERSVVTVKTPAPGRARGEWETEGEDLGEALRRSFRSWCAGALSRAAAPNLSARLGCFPCRAGPWRSWRRIMGSSPAADGRKDWWSWKWN